MSEVGERRTAPELERLCKEARGRTSVSLCASSARLVRPALETLEVELLRSDPDDIPRRASLDGRCAEDLAQLGDLSLHLGNRRDRSGTRIEIIGEPLDRDDPIRLEEQDRKGRALLRPSEGHGALVCDHLERSQDAELEHLGGR